MVGEYRPMLAMLGDESALDKEGYVFEPKLDGFRALCRKQGKNVEFMSRNNIILTSMFPELRSIGTSIKAGSCLIDGEIVIYDNGVPNFNRLQQRAKEGISPQEHKATFVAFDVLSVGGKDVRPLPLVKRKELLQSLIRETERLEQNVYTDDGRRLMQEMRKLRMEGVVAKRRDSAYQSKRSSDWIKIKLVNTADCVIIGYSSNKREIASLALAVYGDGKLLNYVGNVGTGFSEMTLAGIAALLKKDRTDSIPQLRPERGMPRIFYTKPRHVCEVKYLQFTRTGRLRAPVFVRLRKDKRPSGCTMQQFMIQGSDDENQ